MSIEQERRAAASISISSNDLGISSHCVSFLPIIDVVSAHFNVGAGYRILKDINVVIPFKPVYEFLLHRQADGYFSKYFLEGIQVHDSGLSVFVLESNSLRVKIGVLPSNVRPIM